MFHSRAIVVCLLLACAAIAQDAHAQPYRVVELNLPPQFRADVADLNNALQVVGSIHDAATAVNRAVIWDPVNGLRSLPQIPGDVFSLVINNTGSIAGTRGSGPALKAFTLAGGQYIEIQLPADPEGEALRLTDSGILLIRTSAGRSYALYRSQLFDLGPRTSGLVFDIGEDGMVGGSSPDNRPFLRWPDGRVVVPWSAGAVEVIGASGYFAGHGCCASTLFYGRPDGIVMPISIPGDIVEPFRINRAGELVGAVASTQSPLGGFGFVLYRNGSLLNLNQVVNLQGRHLAYATRISDGGAILAGSRDLAAGPDSDRLVLLIPTEPAPPTGLTFSVNGRIVTLQWQSSVSALDYIVEAGSAPGRNDVYNASLGPQLSITTPAPPGRYYVRIRARNAVGVSAPSLEIIIDVP